MQRHIWVVFERTFSKVNKILHIFFLFHVDILAIFGNVGIHLAYFGLFWCILV